MSNKFSKEDRKLQNNCEKKVLLIMMSVLWGIVLN
jgi:hypothetical protein